MSGTRPTSSSPMRARRWRVPPPLTRAGELLEGAEVLTEVSGETAVLLWKSLRTVTLWASAGSPDQVDLFTPGARHRRLAELLTTPVDPEIRLPVETIAALLDGPALVRRESIAVACRQLGHWAASRGARATEIAFVQAAALACPYDADLSLQVARLSHLSGEVARAESWYRRTIMLGRQTGNWTAYSRAFLNLGIAARRRGNFPTARRFDLKALRSATRHGIVEVRAMAYHDLFSISVECDDFSTAQRYAELAWQAYPRQHRQVPYLAHDLCALWMREGQFQRARSVLESLVPLFNEDHRVVPLASLARATGGMRDPEAFERVWSRVVPLLDESGAEGRAAAATPYLAVARGATGVGEWEKATTMAERALEVATKAEEHNMVFEAESLLAFARSRRAIESPVERGADEPVTRQAEHLAWEMVETFTALATV